MRHSAESPDETPVVRDPARRSRPSSGRNTGSENDASPPRNPSSETAIRRRFLQLLSGGLVVGAAGCTSTSTGNRISKPKAMYQAHPNGGDQCSGCQFFQSPTDGGNEGSCTKVKGKIDPDGWCRLYTPG